jgi:hypothetical protein
MLLNRPNVVIEAKLRVKLTKLSDVENFFYGKTTRTMVVEDVMENTCDKRENISPFGIKAIIDIKRHYDKDETHIFEINVNKHYFEEDVMPNTYHCFFIIDEKVYELCLGIKDEQVCDLTLAEWSSVGDFENDGEPLYYYHKDKFRMFNKMY